MERLAIFGWHESLPALLDALERHAGLRAAAVGDEAAMRLMQARNATALPCFQHLLPMARSTAYDVALISTPELSPELAAAVAERGADLILCGDQMDAAALGAAAEAATREGVAVTVVRPSVPSASFLFLSDLVRSGGDWTPQLMQLDLQSDRPVMAQLRDVLPAVTGVWPGDPQQVVASASYAANGDDPTAVAVHLRFDPQSLATITVRRALEPAMRGMICAPAGTVELHDAGDATELALTAADGHVRSERLLHGDREASEAQRVAAARAGHASEALSTQHDAATLVACEQSLATGRVQFVTPPTTRAALRLLEGGGNPVSGRSSARLQLVTA